MNRKPPEKAVAGRVSPEALRLLEFGHSWEEIPKGFCPKAQGCEARATLGEKGEKGSNPNGVVAGRSDTTPLGLGQAGGRCLGVWIILLCLCGITTATAQPVVINEIYYHPPSGDGREEYIELHNRGSSPVDLSGWSLASGVRYTFPDSTIPADGYIVIVADKTVFQAKHPGATTAFGNWVGTLSRRGERLDLRNAAGALVSRVTYADEGDWAVRRRTYDWLNYPTWDWLAEHDGGGKSLELIDPTRDIDRGQNWGSSLVTGGTPGSANSLFRRTDAPFISAVRHTPAVPRSTDRVAVTAKIQGVTGGRIVTLLHSRLDGQTNFVLNPMQDDGLNGDGSAGDGTYGAMLSSQTNGTVVEFYVTAYTEGGEERRWPADPVPAGTPRANLLYQVDEEAYASKLPLYRIIMTEAERAAYMVRISARPGLFSNATTSATFISLIDGRTEVRYQVAVRNRGQGTRYSEAYNFRVDFPSDNLWQDVGKFHLNSYFHYVQLLGSALCQVAGFASYESRAVQFRVNSTNLSPPTWPRYGIYVHNEAPDGDYTKRHQLGQADLYRCLRDYSALSPDLSYRGESPNLYRSDYFKESNQSEDNWTNLLTLVRAMDPTHTPDDQYVEAVRGIIDVTNWVRYFALNTLIVNKETALGSGVGDDYSFYQDPASGKFHLVPWDLDTLLNQGDTTGYIWTDLFVATQVPSINRFLKHPAFAPLYYQQLKDLCDTVFRPERMKPLVTQVWQGLVAATNIEATLNFAEARRAFVLSQIPLELTIEHGLPTLQGYPYTTQANLSLSGRANAIDTRKVLVNSIPATWSAWQARWQADAVALRPGLNRIVVQALDEGGIEISRSLLDVLYETPVPAASSEEIRSTVRWTSSAGPRHLTGTTTIHPDGTLTIEPGVTVYLDAGARVLVRGQLVAQGDDSGRIRFTRLPGSSARWDGIIFEDSLADNRLAGVDLEWGGAGGAVVSARNSRLTIEKVNWSTDMGSALSFDASSLKVVQSVFSGSSVSTTVTGSSIMEGGDLLLQGNTWLTTGGACNLQFSQARRPGPILQFTDNRLLGLTSTALRLTEADAHLEGNLFRGSATATGAAFSGGANYRPHVMLARNCFETLGRGLLLTEGASVTLHNNTFCLVSEAAVAFGPHTPAAAMAAGADLINNLFSQVTAVFAGQQALATPPALSVRWSLFDRTPALQGEGNLEGEARLSWVGNRLETGPGSAAVGQGFMGLDIGHDVLPGATLGATLVSPTPSRQASIRVWGPGLVAYQASLDGGSFGAAQPIDQVIELTGLPNGNHSVAARVQNSAGQWVEPSVTTTFTWQVDTTASPVLLSEIKAAGRGAESDSLDRGGWVELVNRGDQAVNLQGMGLSDNETNPYRFLFSAGLLLAPGEFLVLPSARLGFALDPAGETVSLVGGPIGAAQLLDKIQFGPQVDSFTIARGNEGKWRLAKPTPQAANQPCPLGDERQLRINEWLTDDRNSASGSFVELYNRDTLPVALESLHLSNFPATAPDRQSFPPLSFIAGKGWLALSSSPAASSSQIPLSFAPTTSQGILGLLDAGNNLIDIVWYAPQLHGISMGRVPDGGSDIVSLAAPLPGGPNASSSGLEIRINEVLADNRSARLANGYDGDWIELRNFASYPIDLADMSLTDDPSLPRKFVFAHSTVLPADGLLVLACDPAQPASEGNTGFGLDRAGDAVYLFYTLSAGGTLADSVTFGFQAPDLSLGRAPGNSLTWAPGQPTPGAPNIPLQMSSAAAVKINEWMARPSQGSDWFELFNPGSAPVDLGGCYLTDDPADPVKYRIPDRSFIGFGGFGYRQILADGGASGAADHVPFQLSGDGEVIQLRDPQGNLIDEVVFGPQAAGMSEGRLPDGGSVRVTFPGTASPGAPNFTDRDGDGMADAWETEHGLDPTVPQDALLDSDGDGMNNRAEFIAGTDPRNALSNLTIDVIVSPSAPTKLRFTARPYRSYNLESAPDLSGGNWTSIGRLRTGAREETLDLEDPAPSSAGQRFYRLRVE